LHSVGKPVIMKELTMKLKGIFKIVAAMIISACQSPQQGKIQPELQPDGTWIITAGQTRMQINPAHGARIVSYTFDGVEILHPIPTEGLEDMVGSTNWISPQTLWGWPPPPVADQGNYDAKLQGDTLILTSPLASTGGADPFPFQMVKTIRADQQDLSFTIICQIYNRDTVARSFAAWEVMRVPPSGLTFFPIQGPIFGDLAPGFELTDDIAWWDFNPNNPYVKKAFADGKEGWMAHVTTDRIIHIKQFEDTPSNFPVDDNGVPLQMEMEFWANNIRKYLELEKQGEYKEILPGEYAELTMKWYLQRLPEGIDGKVGSEELVEFVRRGRR
jgi:hypothetical protein